MMIVILVMVMIPCAFSDVPFNVVRDYKWRNLGVCAYCSVEQRCHGAMKYDRTERSNRCTTPEIDWNVVRRIL